MSGIYIPGLSMPRKTGIVSIVLSGDGSALLCEDGHCPYADEAMEFLMEMEDDENGV